MVNMSRLHVRAMMGPQGCGYYAALQVLRGRKALPEHFVYLEQLRKEQLEAARRSSTSDEEEGATSRPAGPLFSGFTDDLFNMQVAWPKDWDGDYKDVAEFLQGHYSEKAEELLSLLQDIPEHLRVSEWRAAYNFLVRLRSVDACAAPRSAGDLQAKYWKMAPLIKRVFGMAEGPEG